MRKISKRKRATRGALLVGLFAWPIACVGNPPQFTPLDGDAGSGDAAGVGPDAPYAPDAPATGDASPARHCNAEQAFNTPPSLVQGIPPGTNRDAFVSANELTIYYDTDAPLPADAGSGHFHLWMATRPDIRSSFHDAKPINGDGFNSSGDDVHPWVSVDKGTLLFCSSRSGANMLYSATSSASPDTYDNPQLLQNVNKSGTRPCAPFVEIGAGLWFASADSAGSVTVQYAPGTITGGFGDPQAVGALGQSDDHPDTPLVTSDRLTLYYTLWPHRQPPYQIWRATRQSASVAFSNPKPVSELNAKIGSGDAPGSISPDGCRLYFSSSREGGSKYDIYMAERNPQ